MPAYRYDALDAEGKAAKGLVEADSAKAARAQLRAQALVPLAVTPVAESTAGASGGVRFMRRVFSNAGLTVWTRQLAGLVGSGLPLERALTALADESEDPRQRELLSHLKSEVNAGSPFARALATAPRSVDEGSRWPRVRASSTRSTAPWWPPARPAARWAPCSSAWPTTSSSARRCARGCWAPCSTRPSCR